MISDWREIQNRLIEGAEDFKAIRFSINNLSYSLRNRYRFNIYFWDNPYPNLEVEDALKKKMEDFLSRSKERHLSERRNLGENIGDDFEAFSSNISDKNEKKKLMNSLKLKAWQTAKGYFLEALCLLAYLSEFESPSEQITTVNLFKKTGPIPVLDKGERRYIWAQPTIVLSKSKLRARPDIVITNSPTEVNKNSIISILECKCSSQISSVNIRGEFGKAFDLEVGSYTVISYHKVSDRLREAANALGIELIQFGLHSDQRKDYILRKLIIEKDLSSQIIKTHTNALFKKTIVDVSKRVMLKE